MNCASCGAPLVATAYGYACPRSGVAEGKCDLAPEAAGPSSLPETVTTAEASTVVDAVVTEPVTTADAVTITEGTSGEANSGGA